MQQSPKIMIVEDELRMCESLESLLKSHGYKVTALGRGQDALDLIAEDEFDLAVLDDHLPYMMGTELIERFKNQIPDISVIVITGDANLDSAIVSLRCGAYD
jgi:DNA-binding NtrC family response regulator